MVRHVIERAMEEGYFCIVSEAQAMQELLLSLFEEVLDSLMVTDITLRGITGGGETKASRIAKGAKQVLNAEVVLDYKVLTVYSAEWKTYDPSKINNRDDVIDIVGYLAQIPVKFPTEIIARDYLLTILNRNTYHGTESSSDSPHSIDGGFSLS